LDSKELKEKKFPTNSFIGGWYIPKEVCKELIDYFEYNKKYSYDGKVGNPNAVDGQVDKSIKDSSDLILGAQNFDNIVGVYRNHLQQVLLNYLNKYTYANGVDAFDIKEDIALQKYKPSGGFKQWHCENNGSKRDRHLVFMTYLNSLKKGGTEFYYQDLETDAETGLTIIWPSAWTHMHRGVVSNSETKYIATGWYSFL
jgi:hypothetical protein